MRAPNVLTISPALPFLDTFVAAFLAGEIVADARSDRDPLVLADATIYVPTRRAARALAEAFLAQASTPTALLPRILPLGALEATETDLLFAEPDLDISGLPLPPAATSIWRRLRLAALIQGWSRAIEGALCSVDAGGTPTVDPSESFRVATSAVDAFALAGDLAALIDELAIENVAWRTLDDLRMAGFDDYWRITTTFLSIAIDLWPKTLAEAGLIDPAHRQIALVDAQSTALASGPPLGPVIAIGSTGTNKATARLLAAIAKAPHGAVVLPGLDLDLDAGAWALVSGARGEGQEPSFGHPQAAMARLLAVIGLSRADVRTIGTPPATAATRARFVAEALRPADTTDLWRAYRRAVPQRVLTPALVDISLIEAADEREEALCLAIAMREVVETPGRTAALVTPDRELARRVRGELLRWNIEVADTGGEPLSGRPLGVLARLVAAAAAGGCASSDVTALLAHPLACFGRPRPEVGRRAAQLGIGVLRVVSLADKSETAIFAEARAAAADPHAHPAQKAIPAADWPLVEALWRAVREALAPLQALQGAQGLGDWVAAHRQCLGAVSGDADPGESEALDTLFDQLAAAAGMPLLFDANAYGTLFGRLATEASLPNTQTPHPRLRIFGLLEARLMRADMMLLGGLDEGIWPPQPTSDPFLNRPMRAELGLLPPERRIGQTAHDFSQAMGAPTIVLSRAKKRAGSPCVASRFLLRLEALGGKAWEASRLRGARYLWLARVLDKPDRAPGAFMRPRPAPPVALRPAQLSVTEIETLRRDPYAIYAAKILKLAPLPRLGLTLDPGEFGSLMHSALHTFAGDAEGTPRIRRERLQKIARDAFASALADPIFRTFRWPIVTKALDTFLAFDAKQRETIRESRVEIGGRLAITLADLSTFMLTARADRIDWHRDGRATLIDYKTGQPPGRTEVQVGFAPQLTLEAAMLREGGFGTLHAGPIAATYLKLGGKDGGFLRELTFDSEPFASVVDRHFAGLKNLLACFRSIETAYPSRPFPKFARDFGVYDHLARVREWSLAADDETAT